MSKQAFWQARVPLSPVVRAGDLLLVSGQTPVGPEGAMVEGTIEAQIRQVLDDVRAAPAPAGAGMADVVRRTVRLEDARDLSAFDAAHAGYLPSEPPARATAEGRHRDRRHRL